MVEEASSELSVEAMLDIPSGDEPKEDDVNEPSAEAESPIKLTAGLFLLRVFSVEFAKEEMCCVSVSV